MAFFLRQSAEADPERIAPQDMRIKERPVPELGAIVIYVVFASIWEIFLRDILDRLMGDPVDSIPLNPRRA
jgi:hypothetical protein